MGSQVVKIISSKEERKKLLDFLLDDIAAFKQIEKSDGFVKGRIHVGAEQELCIVKDNFRPSINALRILEKINDPHFTTELALFNLEINLDPIPLKNHCFKQLEQNLQRLLAKAHKASSEIEDNKILLNGILPTLRKKDLIFDNMTPLQRYTTLNNAIKQIKEDHFKLRIRGVDELILNHDSILFEACNTSFQVHLQINLDEAVDQYNWAQVIAGPVLSLMTNSPLLLNRELWAETRIALFQQSIDMRNTAHLLREQKARVSFGSGWVNQSVCELFMDDICRYTPLITGELNEKSTALLKKGITPKLEALNLHNGTLYKWNRLCYGVHNNKPHLRIENRYISAGPSVKDEVANALFWVGVMTGMPEKYKNIQKKMNFKDARGNFIRAARTGMDTYFNWFGKGYTAKDLAEEILLPIAREGLKKHRVAQEDIDYYLNIIQQRITKNITGSKWQIRAIRKLQTKASSEEAGLLMTYKMYKNQRTDKPVHQWGMPNLEAMDHEHRVDKVYKIMTKALFVVNKNDAVHLVSKIMKWKKIKHIPVVDKKGKIIGIISKSNIDAYNNKRKTDELISVSRLMERDVITISPEMKTKDAKALMIEKGIGSLPVVDDGELVGIITSIDLKEIVQYL